MVRPCFRLENIVFSFVPASAFGGSAAGLSRTADASAHQGDEKEATAQDKPFSLDRHSYSSSLPRAGRLQIITIVKQLLYLAIALRAMHQTLLYRACFMDPSNLGQKCVRSCAWFANTFGTYPHFVTHPLVCHLTPFAMMLSYVSSSAYAICCRVGTMLLAVAIRYRESVGVPFCGCCHDRCMLVFKLLLVFPATIIELLVLAALIFHATQGVEHRIQAFFAHRAYSILAASQAVVLIGFTFFFNLLHFVCLQSSRMISSGRLHLHLRKWRGPGGGREAVPHTQPRDRVL